MKPAEMITVGVPGRGDLSGCSVPDLRECLDGSRRARAVLDAFDTRIVSLLETAARAVGTHERGASKASMSDDSSNPDTQWVVVQSSGILLPASVQRLDARSISVQSSEISSPVSPCRETWRPHRRMDRIRMLGSMKVVVMRDGNDGTNVRVAAVSIFGTDVCGEVCPSVPHPLGRVGARLRSFRSASFRHGSGCGVSSCVGGGV
jgi:hypothetical protein